MALQDIFPIDLQETRAGFGAGMYELAKQNKDIVLLTADLAGSMRIDKFLSEYKHQFVQCGVSEANMMSMASGLAISGKIPFTTTFANFSTGRVYDQIRQSICYSNKNVKICASHAGLTLGEDGATHQILEDIGMMKMLPNMRVVSPCDFNQTKAAAQYIATDDGPIYLRFGRPKVANFTNEKDFIFGKAQILSYGFDITIIATGHLVWECVIAGKQLENMGYSVELINIHTIKPIDEEAILLSAQKTKRVLTAEEHQQNGGLGESISSILSRKLPTLMKMVAVQDKFGESGKPEQLLQKYELDAKEIIVQALALLNH